MPENNESRKVNLADAIRQKLEQKNSRMRPRISPDNSKPVQHKNEKPKQQNQTTSVVVPAVRRRARFVHNAKCASHTWKVRHF